MKEISMQNNLPGVTHNTTLHSNSLQPKILFQDKHLIICVKPYGIVSESPGMPELLEQICKCSVYCVHRLDKGTGGIMIFAKDCRTAALLSSQTSDSYKKEYLAVINGKPDEQGEFCDFLFHDRYKNKTYVVDRIRKGVKEAKLSYQLLECHDQLSLVLVRLQTGRTHQIRAQFASRKLPLIGDVKYGSPVRNSEIGLWAYRITFIHPYTGKTVTFSELPPDTSNWQIWRYSFDNILPNI